MERSDRDLISLNKALDNYLEQEAGSNRLSQHGGLGTGFMDLDRLLGGFQPSDLIILAARPGVGKSALALNIAKAVTTDRRADGRRGVVAFFSLEMATEQVVERLLAGETGIDTRRLRVRGWTDHDEATIMDAVGRLAELPLYIDDSSMLGVMELRSKARRLYLEVDGLDLIVVDYLQLMRGSAAFGGNRVQEISEISRSLKGLARDLNVPVLALSQLSRAVEGRPGHEPMLSDLRESGSIEQDADVVIFIYRPDVYFTEEEWDRQHPGEEYPRGIADLIIAKHRNGPLGRPQLVFRERTTTFADAVRPDGASPNSMF
jgi:replicative DNA helicase